MKNIKLNSRVIALLMMLGSIPIVREIISTFEGTSGLMEASILFFVLILVGLVYLQGLVLNLTAATGLLLTRNWGFITSYLAILYSTFILRICYLPYVSTLFPPKQRFPLIVLTNSLILLYVVYVNILFYENKRALIAPKNGLKIWKLLLLILLPLLVMAFLMLVNR